MATAAATKKSFFIAYPDSKHNPEKWKPVSRKDYAQTKRFDHDAISLNRIMI
jgi:hypothetical protein